jgi:hypothetical protein
MTDRPIPERKHVKEKLRELGMTHRQIDGLLRAGWKNLVGETQAENEELHEQLKQLHETLR